MDRAALAGFNKVGNYKGWFCGPTNPDIHLASRACGALRRLLLLLPCKAIKECATSMKKRGFPD